MYLYFLKIKSSLGDNFDYIFARLLSLPILFIILALLSGLPNGKANSLIYAVMLVGAMVNGTLGQSLFQHGLDKNHSLFLFNFYIALIEFILISFVGIVNGIYFLGNIEVSSLLFCYVFLRVMTMTLMNHLYLKKHYIQSINFIFSKLIDLFLVYFVCVYKNNLDLTITQIPLLVMFSLVFIFLFLCGATYFTFGRLIQNSLIRLPVSLLYMVFSFLFFNISSNALSLSSSFLLRLKGLFDALASIVSVVSLKSHLITRPALTKFYGILILNLLSAVVINFNLLLGMLSFAVAAVFSAKIYSRTVVAHGIFWYSVAWSSSLLLSIVMMLFSPDLSNMAYAVCEMLPLLIIYCLDHRVSK